MHVLIACKYEKDQLKNSEETVMMSCLKVFEVILKTPLSGDSINLPL